MATNPISILQSENNRLKSDNEALRGELSRLREFVHILNELIHKTPHIQDDSELMPLLHDILIKALNLLQAPDGSLALLDEETNELVFVLVIGALASDLEGYRLPAGEGIAGWVVQHQEAALVRDVRRDTRFFANVDNEFKYQTQSIAAAPLLGDGKVLGMVEALNKPGDTPFNDLDLELLMLFCRFAGEALADIQRRTPVAE